ncbi:hypothetical protein [Rhodococcus tibetensis]|uniref:Uncharacterized protein n=1 Tax=Rhodococcus tibetensis TaxID=2965064 RepID=A0ABT1QDR1_9NOCA|nr:hypothetical protein [Rhodococcus sp. FXJ9.536]MCQ4119865.1 hypothetical protein [Rhodococcus sp. FXJ9.536]
MSLGIERAREQKGLGSHTEQCDRGIAQAVREVDEMRAENAKLLAVVDRYRQERDEAREEATRIQARQIAEVADRIDSRSNAMVMDLVARLRRVEDLAGRADWRGTPHGVELLAILEGGA